MNRIASSARCVWKSAQLYIGFHRDPEGKMRKETHVWPTKNGNASIHRDPNEQEAFIMLKSAEGDSDQDAQIKLRPDMVVLRRNYNDAWDGIIINEHALTVKVAGVSIKVNHDGSVTRQDGDSTTWVEADGGVLKKTDYVEAAMSSDGIELARRTPDNLTAITSTDLLSKDR